MYGTTEIINGNFWGYGTLSPGKSVITFTDIYGQKITFTVSITQKLYNSRTETYDVVTSEIADNTLPVPKITFARAGYRKSRSIVFDFQGLSSESCNGYECYVSHNKNFEYDVETKTGTLNNNGCGSVYFTDVIYGYTHYIKIRAFTIKNNIKIVGPWSEISKVDLPIYDTEGTNPAKYTYEVYGLDKQKADIYTECDKPLFIKTDNPDVDSFSLVCNGESPLIEVVAGGTTHIYDDIPYENDDSESDLLKKVKGGYIGYVYFKEAGTYNIEFREYYLSGYTVAKTVTVNVIDYDQAAAAWATDIINKTTTSDMTPWKKMEAVCDYLTDGRFKYLTVYNNDVVRLASEPNEPYFITYRWDSWGSPAALCEFAKLIGGFDDIHNCYNDYPAGSAQWAATHYRIILTIGNEKRSYYVCPFFQTGEVEKPKMINLTDLSNMRKFG